MGIVERCAASFCKRLTGNGPRWKRSLHHQNEVSACVLGHQSVHASAPSLLARTDLETSIAEGIVFLLRMLKESHSNYK